MKLIFLDTKSIGGDISLSGFCSLGEVVSYPFSTRGEALRRTADADVIITNKVEINEQTIGNADHLKLVCVTATGTNHLDKDYLKKRGIAWRNVAGYSTDSVAQHTFAMLFYLLEKLRFYEDTGLSLKALYRLEKGLNDALAARVWLKSGAYLVIEPTEALTVIVILRVN